MITHASLLLPGLSDFLWNTVYKELSYLDTYSALPVLLRPRSRGRLTLRSASPFIHPSIQPNYLSDPENRDVSVIVEGIKIALAHSQTSAMSRFGVALYPKPYPPCAQFPTFSDAYWACATRHYTSTIYHPVGKCLSISTLSILSHYNYNYARNL